jgi:hypothetical protein
MAALTIAPNRTNRTNRTFVQNVRRHDSGRNRTAGHFPLGNVPMSGPVRMGGSKRDLLPAPETIGFDFRGLAYMVSVGRFADGSLAELLRTMP